MKAPFRQASKTPTRFPVGTIAAYGPNTALATKLVVSVLKRSDQHEPSTMRIWTTAIADVRHDPTISAEVAQFLEEHGVKDSLASDRVIGCPHEEGIDYPMGRNCSHCPFWAGIDRFTHEPLTPASPTLSPEEILANLSSERTDPPLEALESADGHRLALTDHLLQAIEYAVDDPIGASEEDATLFAYALYLMAKWREPRAYPYVIRWLLLPGEGAFDIGGDVVTQDGARILAAVYDGNLDPIKALILNRSANEFSRGAGLSALALLAAWAEVPRELIVDYFVWLARDGLEREPSQVWNSLAAESADIEALAVFGELRRAYDDGLIEPQFMHPSELDAAEASPRGRLLEETRERHPPIVDVVRATAWWASFAKHRSYSGAAGSIRATPKVGRNQPCPCGSGKKYKRCCGG